MYRFYLDIFNTTKQVYPKFEKTAITSSRESEQFFLRKKFPKFQFIGEDFDFINNGSIYYEYTLRWEKWDDGEYREILRGTFTKAKCSEIDEDLKIIEVEPKVEDRYTKLLEFADVEYDFLKYNPSVSSVQYSRKPIIQVYVLGSNKITNILKDRSWEQECTVVNDSQVTGIVTANQVLVNDYYFGDTPILKAYISGVGAGVTPNVTGQYTDEYFNTNRNAFKNGIYRIVSYGLYDSNGEINGSDVDLMRGWYSFVLTSGTLDDTDFDSSWDFPLSVGGTTTLKYVGKFGSNYYFKSLTQQVDISLSGTMTHNANANNTGSKSFTRVDISQRAFRWAIYNTASSEYVFIAPMFENLNENPTYNKATTFTKATKNGTSGYIIDTSTQVRLFQAEIYARTLYNPNIDIGVADADQKVVPEEDIIPNSPNYTLVEPLNLTDAQLFMSDNNSATEDIYGRISNDAIYFAGNYFNEVIPISGNDAIPINLGQWTEVSTWFEHTAATNAIQANTETILLRHAYKLSDVIDVLLEQIDNTVTHGGTSAVSDFLYGVSNSIRGTQREVFITPKSNIITANYDTPATKSVITFNSILNLLRNVYNCYIDIDEDNKLIIEHVQYFMNGRTYTGTNSSIDLTQVINPRTGKAITSQTNKYSYEQQEIPQFIEIKWLDETSDDFDGEYIECLDNFVQKGLIDSRSADKFTSDIDYIGINSNEISKAGFVLFEATLTGGIYTIVEPTITVNGRNKTMQNGYLSVPYLQKTYMIYNAPSNTMSINGGTHDISVDGGSLKRNKIQELELPNVLYVDEQRLITTSLGSGLVVDKEDTTDDGTLKIKIEHDTEL